MSITNLKLIRITVATSNLGTTISCAVKILTLGKLVSLMIFYENDDGTRSYFQDCTPLQLPNHVSASDCTWNTTREYTRTLGDIESKTDIPCKIMWPCGLIAGSFFNDIFQAFT